MPDASNQGTAGIPMDGELDRAVTPQCTIDVAQAQLQSQVVSLYESHGAELRRFVLGVVRDPDLAGDVMQATLSKALELGHTARPESFKGWIFRVAYHEALALRRRGHSADRAHRRLADLGLVVNTGARCDEPVDGLIQGEKIDAVRRALGALPDPQRRVVLARVYDDKTFAEIASEAGLPLGTVLTRMRLALNKLRDALGVDADTGRTTKR